MTRKAKQPTIACEYYEWKLFQRDGVFYADGRRSGNGKHSLRTRNREQALRRLRQLDRFKAKQRGLAVPKATGPVTDITIADGWKAYLDHCSRPAVLGGVSASTLRRYTGIQNLYIEFCASRNIAYWREFDKACLEAYAAQRKKKGRADRTIYLEVLVLKSVMAFLIREKRLGEEHRIQYTLRRPSGTDTYCYEEEEVAAMLKLCMADPELLWLGRVILALALLGVRIGELAALRWTDVDLRANTVRIADERSSARKSRSGTARRTKGKKSRTIPLHLQLKQELQKMSKNEDGLVFHDGRGRPLRGSAVRWALITRVINPLKEQFPSPPDEIGFADGRVHSFRHYFCSQAFIAGIGAAEIKDWLGHADSKMVEHYRHLNDTHSQRQMQRIRPIGDDLDAEGVHTSFSGAG